MCRRGLPQMWLSGKRAPVRPSSGKEEWRRLGPRATAVWSVGCSCDDRKGEREAGQPNPYDSPEIDNFWAAASTCCSCAPEAGWRRDDVPRAQLHVAASRGRRIFSKSYAHKTLWNAMSLRPQALCMCLCVFVSVKLRTNRLAQPQVMKKNLIIIIITSN